MQSKSVTDNIYNDLTDIKLPSIQIDSSLSFNDNDNLANNVDSISELKLEGESFALENSKLARGNFTLPEDVFSTQGQLTSSNKTDMYFFSVNTDRFLGIKLDSSNTNYELLLCQVDWNEGVARPTNISTSSNEATPKLCGLVPAGDYALRVSSKNNAYGSSYILRYNVANPAGQNVLFTLKPDLSIITAYYGYQTLISNGKNLIREDHQWDKHYTFSDSGNYVGLDNSVGPIKVKMAHLGTYKSTSVSSDNALFLELDVGTTVLATRSFYENGKHYTDYADSLGKETPRALDANDIANSNPHYLVIDLNTNKVIDFYSILNWYFVYKLDRPEDSKITFKYYDY